MYFGSFADSCPASKIPKRVQADPAIRAAPESTASVRLRPASSEPTAPPIVSARDAFISRPALPWCSGSAVMPIDRSMRCSISSSTTAPPAANRRAGPAWSVGEVTMPRPPEAAAADDTNTNGSSLNAACQDGVAVSESSTAV